MSYYKTLTSRVLLLATLLVALSVGVSTSTASAMSGSCGAGRCTVWFSKAETRSLAQDAFRRLRLRSAGRCGRRTMRPPTGTAGSLRSTRAGTGVRASGSACTRGRGRLLRVSLLSQTWACRYKNTAAPVAAVFVSGPRNFTLPPAVLADAVSRTSSQRPPLAERTARTDQFSTRVSRSRALGRSAHRRAIGAKAPSDSRPRALEPSRAVLAGPLRWRVGVAMRHQLANEARVRIVAVTQQPAADGQSVATAWKERSPQIGRLSRQRARFKRTHRCRINDAVTVEKLPRESGRRTSLLGRDATPPPTEARRSPQTQSSARFGESTSSASAGTGRQRRGARSR